MICRVPLSFLVHDDVEDRGVRSRDIWGVDIRDKLDAESLRCTFNAILCVSERSAL